MFHVEHFISRHHDMTKENQYDVLLNNHALSGEYVGCRSINITGDVRAIYEEIKDNHFEFVAIGTHTELYG